MKFDQRQTYLETSSPSKRLCTCRISTVDIPVTNVCQSITIPSTNFQKSVGRHFLIRSTDIFIRCKIKMIHIRSKDTVNWIPKFSYLINERQLIEYPLYLLGVYTPLCQSQLIKTSAKNNLKSELKKRKKKYRWTFFANQVLKVFALINLHGVSIFRLKKVKNSVSVFKCLLDQERYILQYCPQIAFQKLCLDNRC